MMNELKPEDVMKALECCTTDKITLGVPCRNCPYSECNIVGGKGERQTSGTCRSWLMKDALTLLREKDATIEALIRDGHAALRLSREKDAEIERLNTLCSICPARGHGYSKGWNDAITEFAEKLKSNNEKRDGLSFKVVSSDTIDQIAQELIETERKKVSHD